jgi:hypothetical protein
MTKEKKYILIDCWVNIYDIAYEYCKILQKNGDYYSVNLTLNKDQFDVKSVTKEQFNETIK